MPRVAVRRLGRPRGPGGNLLGLGKAAGTWRGPGGDSPTRPGIK